MEIVWAIEGYTYTCTADTSPFYTDCRPVQLIFDNVKSKQPASIEWWNIQLQGYDFSVIHTQGVKNPSDFLSQHAYQNEVETRENDRITTTSSSPVLYTKPCLMRRLNKQPKMKKHTSRGDDQHKPVGNIS